MQETPLLPSRGVLVGFAALIAFLTCGVYGSSLRNDFVRFDDGLLIYENPAVREMSLRSLRTIFTTYDPELYIPFTLLSYKFDYLLGGTNPFVYHLHNLLLHALNVLLIAWCVYLLTSQKWLALFVSVLFAIHPLHTEAVSWASARKDLLSTFFFLASLLSYLYYCGREGREGRRAYFLSVFLFLCGLLSKVMVVTLPLILFLVDWRNGRKLDRSMFFDKVPFFALSVLFGIIALLGKRAVTAEATALQTLLMAFKSTVFYLQKLFIPTGLSVLYPYTEPIRLSSPDFFLPLLVLLVLFVLLAYSLRCTKELLFGFLFFAITLLPTFVNFSKGGDFYFASDRYAYIPSIGILFAVGWLLSVFLRREARVRVIWQKLFGTVAALFCVVFLFSVLTIRQSLVWADTETLFRNVLVHYPHSHRARNNLANTLRRQGLLEEAVAEFKAALAIREHPKTLSNLGAVYRKLGRMEEALELYEKALAIAPDDPEPHFGLGIVYMQQGDFSKALASYERAVVLDPEYVDVYNNMGALFAQQGAFDRASEAYRKALAINPLYYQAHYNLGVALESLSRPEEALRAYEAAMDLEPTFTPARINLALLLYRLGKISEAQKQFQEALKIDPKNATARAALEQLRGVR